jgi:hypothetical protein
LLFHPKCAKRHDLAPETPPDLEKSQRPGSTTGSRDIGRIWRVAEALEYGAPQQFIPGVGSGPDMNT